MIDSETTQMQKDSFTFEQIVPSLFEKEDRTDYQYSLEIECNLINLELEMDETLAKLMEEETPLTSGDMTSKKKRGRKPLRPNDPIKKKTEEKDKYWLRAFRAHMKQIYPYISESFSRTDHKFWVEYLGQLGKPEKGKKYLSYGKKYKDFLFNNSSFAKLFRQWFYQFGFAEMSKKCNPQSPLWVVFYDYALEELVNYVPKNSSRLDTQTSLQEASNLLDLDQLCVTGGAANNRINVQN